LTFDETFHGLQVVDVSSGEQIARLASSAYEVGLSSDGTQLFLRGWDDEKPWTDVYTADGLKLIKHIYSRHLQTTLTLGGDAVLLSNSSYWNGTRMGLVDPAGLASTSELELKEWKLNGFVLTIQP
jgi:hypothetical protein